MATKAIAKRIEKAEEAAEKPTTKTVVISPPKFEQATITIVGNAPLVVHKFSTKAKNQIVATQEAGSQAKKGAKREAKDFDAVYKAACHVAAPRFGGWYGLPASAFRNAMISACRVVGFKMTLAKLSVFCVADGFDEDGTGLVKITKGSPEMFLAPARNANGSIDIRARPKWDEGWEAEVTLRWDADQFSGTDIANLLSRVGLQVGVGEGRSDSRMSAGCGWGSFDLKL